MVAAIGAVIAANEYIEQEMAISRAQENKEAEDSPRTRRIRHSLISDALELGVRMAALSFVVFSGLTIGLKMFGLAASAMGFLATKVLAIDAGAMPQGAPS